MDFPTDASLAAWRARVTIGAVYGRRERHPGFAARWTAALAVLAACDAPGFTLTSPWRRRRRAPAFVEAWAEAVTTGWRSC